MSTDTIKMAALLVGAVAALAFIIVKSIPIVIAKVAAAKRKSATKRFGESLHVNDFNSYYMRKERKRFDNVLAFYLTRGRPMESTINENLYDLKNFTTWAEETSRANRVRR